MVSTSAYHTDGPGSIPSHDSHDIFGVKTWLSTSGLCITHESENHVNVSPVSAWDIKEPLRITSGDHPQCQD